VKIVSVNIIELKRIISYIIRSKGASALTLNELCYALSLDYGWFTPEEAKKIINLALERELIECEASSVKILFDCTYYSVPVGYKPTCASLKKSLFDELLEWMAANGVKKSDVLAMVNKRRSSLGGLIEVEVALLLVARDMGFDVRNFAKDVYIEILYRRQMPL